MKKIMLVAATIAIMISAAGCFTEKKEETKKVDTVSTEKTGIETANPQGRLTGIVVDSEGKAIAGVKVTAAGQTVLSNENGAFTFDVLDVGNDATYPVVFYKKNYLTKDASVSYKDTLGNDKPMDGNENGSSVTNIESNVVTLRVPLGNAVSSVKVEMVELVTLTGKLIVPVGGTATIAKIAPDIQLLDSTYSKLMPKSEYSLETSTSSTFIIKDVPRINFTTQASFKLKAYTTGLTYASYYYDYEKEVKKSKLNLLTSIKTPNVKDGEQATINVGDLELKKYYTLKGNVYKESLYATSTPAAMGANVKVVLKKGTEPEIIVDTNSTGVYKFVELVDGVYNLTLKQFVSNNFGRIDYWGAESFDPVNVGATDGFSSVDSEITRDLWFKNITKYTLKGKVGIGINNGNYLYKSGLKVFLMYDVLGSGVSWTNVASTTTDAEGNYQFDNVTYGGKIKVKAEGIDTDANGIDNFKYAEKVITEVADIYVNASIGVINQDLYVYANTNEPNYRLSISQSKILGKAQNGNFVVKEEINADEAIVIAFNLEIANESVQAILKKGERVAKLLEGSIGGVEILSTVTVTGSSVSIKPIVKLDPAKKYTILINKALMSVNGYPYGVQYGNTISTGVVSGYTSYANDDNTNLNMENIDIVKSETYALTAIKPEIFVSNDLIGYSAANFKMEYDLTAAIYKDVTSTSATYLDVKLQNYSANALAIKFAIDSVKNLNTSEYKIFVRGTEYNFWQEAKTILANSITKEDILKGLKTTTVDLTPFVNTTDKLGFGNSVSIIVIPCDLNGKPAAFDDTKAIVLNDTVGPIVADNVVPVLKNNQNKVEFAENLQPTGYKVEVLTEGNSNYKPVIANARIADEDLKTIKYDINSGLTIKTKAYEDGKTLPAKTLELLTSYTTKGLYEGMTLIVSTDEEDASNARKIVVSKILSESKFEFTYSGAIFDIKDETFVISKNDNNDIFARTSVKTNVSKVIKKITNVITSAGIVSITTDAGMTVKLEQSSTTNPLLGINKGDVLTFKATLSVGTDITLTIQSVKNEKEFVADYNATKMSELLNTSKGYKLVLSQVTVGSTADFVINEGVKIVLGTDAGTGTIGAIDNANNLLYVKNFTANDNIKMFNGGDIMLIPSKDKTLVLPSGVKLAVGDTVIVKKVQGATGTKKAELVVASVTPVDKGVGYAYEYGFTTAIPEVVELYDNTKIATIDYSVEFKPTLEVKITGKDTSGNSIQGDNDTLFYDADNSKWSTK